MPNIYRNPLLPTPSHVLGIFFNLNQCVFLLSLSRRFINFYIWKRLLPTSFVQQNNQFWHFFKVLVCRLTYRFEIAGSFIVCHPRDNQGAKNLLSPKLRHQVAFRWLGKELLKHRYRGSPLSTNSLSTISGIVGCQIVLNSSMKSLIYRGSPNSTNFAHPGNRTIEKIVSDLSKTDQTWSNWIPRLYKNDMY